MIEVSLIPLWLKSHRVPVACFVTVLALITAIALWFRRAPKSTPDPVIVENVTQAARDEGRAEVFEQRASEAASAAIVIEEKVVMGKAAIEKIEAQRPLHGSDQDIAKALTEVGF